MTSRAEWAIRSRSEWPSGLYVQLNVATSGREGAGTVTVKHRARPGEPFVCFTCLSNSCAHCEFVADQLASEAAA